MGEVIPFRRPGREGFMEFLSTLLNDEDLPCLGKDPLATNIYKREAEILADRLQAKNNITPSEIAHETFTSFAMAGGRQLARLVDEKRLWRFSFRVAREWYSLVF